MARFEIFDALESPRFRRLYVAGVVSQLGDWMQIFARPALAFQLTGEASSVGLIYFASYLPQLLFSFFGGVLADRYDRRVMLIGTQVVQASMAILLGVLVAADAISVTSLGVISFVAGIGFMLAIPAAQALTPSLVPRESLQSAISLSTATNAIIRVFGPPIAGFVIATAGIQWVFWINALSFAAVVIAWAVTPVERQPALAERRNLAAIREGLREVRRSGRLWVPIVVSTVLGSIGVVYQPLLIPFATEVLAGGDTDLGTSQASWLQGAIGVGAALGILGLAAAGRRRPGRTLMATGLAFSFTLVGLGLVGAFPVAFVVCFVLGAMQFANMTLAMNLVQHEVPREELRGRIMAVHMTGLIGFVPIVAVVGGAIADAVGTRWLIAGAGVLCVLFSLVALRWTRLVRPGSVERESAETIAAIGQVEAEEG